MHQSEPMTKGIVISLYDFTGEALRPWAEAGYECYAFDIQHSKENVNTDTYEGGGTIEYVHLDLHNINNLEEIRQWFHDSEIPVVFGMAFPVCTDLAVSGAAHFKRKAERDPEFQIKASNYARWCDWLFETMEIPYFIENPVSRLATLWRKPNYSFHPYEYGGYIPDDQAEHPRWPEYIASKDAYPKKTCLWTGGGFTMPERKAVPVPQGYSTQHKKLGGKSKRTKDIRSATPRGFAKAVYEANKVKETTQ